MRLKIFLIALLLPFTAFAADEDVAPPVVYSPPECEFSVAFPTEPYKTQRCDEEDKSTCYTQISYTQTYDMDSTVNFRVTCNPVGKDVADFYTEEVMKTTLKAMTKRSVVKTFNASFRQETNYKQAGLVGEGKSGTLPTIYIAQLWIGAHSAFSVEGELIGEAADKPDKLFSEVLKSVHYVGDKPKEDKKAEDKDDDKDEDKKEDDKKEDKKKDE